MTIEELNSLNDETAIAELTKCCGAHNWVDRMNQARPFEDKKDLISKADELWFNCEKSDWLEAFDHHPKIGNVESLSKKFSGTKKWAGEEQKSVDTAPLEIIEKLAELNSHYEDKFGFIFIVCATGKSAMEMLDILESRMGNEYPNELRIAMEEQNKITALRLNKLIT